MVHLFTTNPIDLKAKYWSMFVQTAVVLPLRGVQQTPLRVSKVLQHIYKSWGREGLLYRFEYIV